MDTEQELIPRTVSATRWKLALLTALSAIFVIGCWFLIQEDDSRPLIAGWVGIALFGPGGLVTFYLLFSGSPKIIIDKNGLRFIHAFRQPQWPWAEVGPFSVSVQTVRFNRMVYICAFSDHHHDLLEMQGHGRPAHYIDADISIPLQFMPPGKTETSAQAFVEELNEWRSRYGRPQVETDTDNPNSALIALNRKIRNRRVIYWAAIGLTIAAVVAFEIFVPQ